MTEYVYAYVGKASFTKSKIVLYTNVYIYIMIQKYYICQPFRKTTWLYFKVW